MGDKEGKGKRGKEREGWERDRIYLYLHIITALLSSNSYGVPNDKWNIHHWLMYSVWDLWVWSVRERGRTESHFIISFLVFLVSIARGCGACLNFSPAVVIILMYRQIITFLRSTKLSFLFPLDKYIKLHKIVGYTIIFFSIIHVLAHLANFSKYFYMIMG